ncbi:MAG: hypothetical protein KatS3mg003_0046 [Candidatus Nitrosocaldaceae archaeon]|nr:MAG: hypothetical protein KatS3mg003_0046 [Candidatus Nitrosocaldaceae archaeon]
MDMEKYRDMFVQEALEHLNNLNTTLLSFEKNNNREDLDSLFRSAHTIKGMAATMGYDNIRILCKAIEDIFDDLRNNKVEFRKEMGDLLLNCFDLLERMIIDESFEVDLEPFLNSINEFKHKKSIVNNIHLNNSSIINETNELPSTIKVNLKDLDLLVDLVGELVITKMRLEEIFNNNSELNGIIVSLNRLVADLQYLTMKLRLIPLETIFARFPRVVRDAASKAGKEVNFEMEGTSIEVDRSILQAITDPLLHILRNAVDHGIEPPQEREKSGKSKSGKIRLVAEKQGDNVIITVEDDGKGIDKEGVISKAIEKGVITREGVDKLSDDEVYALLALPGLSTAKKVTDISGRGVGMDVVFKQVESVGGHIKIESKKNEGSKFILSIPLSISIISGLIVTVADSNFVIPLSSVVTTTIISNNDIQYIHGNKVIILADKIVPLIDIRELLQIDKKRVRNKLSIVVVDKNGKQVGLIVDSFEYKQDIVIKHISNIDKQLKFPDATIAADGTPLLILDPAIILQQ